MPPVQHRSATDRVKRFFAGGRHSEQHSVYLLENHSHRTYVGYSTSPRRRLKQHNGFLPGGANRTRRGRPWQLRCFVRGFTSEHRALQFEYAWNNPSTACALRGQTVPHNPCSSLNKRLQTLMLLLKSAEFRNERVRLTLVSVSSENRVLRSVPVPIYSRPNM